MAPPAAAMAPVEVMAQASAAEAERLQNNNRCPLTTTVLGQFAVTSIITGIVTGWTGSGACRIEERVAGQKTLRP